VEPKATGALRSLILPVAATPSHRTLPLVIGATGRCWGAVVAAPDLLHQDTVRAVAVLARLVQRIDALTGLALGEVSSLSSTRAVDLQVLSLVKNVKPRGFPPGVRGSSRTLSRSHLPPCAALWYPGKGRLLAGPRSAGTFYSSKIKPSLAWWNDPVQCTPAAVYCWLSQGVKVEFGRDFRPLTLAPRQVHPSEIPFVLADQDKGRRAGAYVV
jgi:hypothetical protein